jgi:hypothetical protein
MKKIFLSIYVNAQSIVRTKGTDKSPIECEYICEYGMYRIKCVSENIYNIQIIKNGSVVTQYTINEIMSNCMQVAANIQSAITNITKK